jgi:bifunctional DNA-binding transcriptional regulator/antitoxin component of YhaV-PrlF toxin-antitoxin module
MPTLKVTAKGQVTFRKDVLRHLGVRPGEKISVELLPGGRVVATAMGPESEIADIFNLFQRKGGPSLTIEEIGELAADGWAGKR